MKVVHININFIHSALHQEMIRHLSKLGIYSEVFVPTHSLNIGKIIPDSNVKVVKCFKYFDRFFYFLKQKKIQKTFEKIIEISKFDIIHAYTLFSDGNTAMKMSIKYNKPFIVAIRDTDVNKFYKYRPYLYWRGLKIMRKASYLVFLSKTYRDIIIHKYVPKKYRFELEKKSIIIPNGIDDFWFSNRMLYIPEVHIDRIKEKQLKIIFVGEISKRKNTSMIVSAADILRKRGWKIKLTFVGKKTYSRDVRVIMADSNSNLVSPVNKESLINYYRESDIFVMPSHTETFGLTYAESLSQGIPVIYTKGQGFDGQFIDGMVGYPVISTSSNNIANMIERVAQEYNNLANNCINKCTAFKWDKISKKYIELYNYLDNV